MFLQLLVWRLEINTKHLSHIRTYISVTVVRKTTPRFLHGHESNASFTYRYIKITIFINLLSGLLKGISNMLIASLTSTFSAELWHKKS